MNRVAPCQCQTAKAQQQPRPDTDSVKPAHTQLPIPLMLRIQLVEFKGVSIRSPTYGHSYSVRGAPGSGILPNSRRLKTQMHRGATSEAAGIGPGPGARQQTSCTLRRSLRRQFPGSPAVLCLHRLLARPHCGFHLITDNTRRSKVQGECCDAERNYTGHSGAAVARQAAMGVCSVAAQESEFHRRPARRHGEKSTRVWGVDGWYASFLRGRTFRADRSAVPSPAERRHSQDRSARPTPSLAPARPDRNEKRMHNRRMREHGSPSRRGGIQKTLLTAQTASMHPLWEGATGLTSAQGNRTWDLYRRPGTVPPAGAARGPPSPSRATLSRVSSSIFASYGYHGGKYETISIRGTRVWTRHGAFPGGSFPRLLG